MKREDPLETERTLWLATVRPDGRPHLSPIWFAWVDGSFWMCTNRSAVKARNIDEEPRVSLSLGTGEEPVVAEGRGLLRARPYPPSVVEAFERRFRWDISTPDDDGPYDALIEVRVDRWLMGRPQ